MSERVGDRRVLRLTPAWREAPMRADGNVGKVLRDPDGTHTLLLFVWHDGIRHGLQCKVNPGGDPGPGDPLTWGLKRIGPGTWDVLPSIHAPGALHAYVTLCNVPEPPPWEPSP